MRHWLFATAVCALPACQLLGLDSKAALSGPADKITLSANAPPCAVVDIDQPLVVPLTTTATQVSVIVELANATTDTNIERIAVSASGPTSYTLPAGSLAVGPNVLIFWIDDDKYVGEHVRMLLNGVAETNPSASTTDSDGDCYSPAMNDCDDSNPTVNPGATEVCHDRIDNNCNALADQADPACAGVTYTTVSGAVPSSGDSITPQAPITVTFSGAVEPTTLIVTDSLGVTAQTAFTTVTAANDTLTFTPPATGWPIGPALPLIISVSDIQGDLVTWTGNYTVSVPGATFTLAPVSGSTVSPITTFIVTFSASINVNKVTLVTGLGATGATVTPSTTNVAHPNDTLTIAPSHVGLGWPIGTTDKLSVNVTDINGNNFLVDATYNVYVPPPTFAVYPQTVINPPTTAIVVSFSASMNPSSLALPATVLGVTGATTKWTTAGNANDTVTITPPAGGWKIAKGQSFSMQATDLYGNVVQVTEPFDVQVPPATFLGVFPSDQATIQPANGPTVTPPNTTIVITFSETMDTTVPVNLGATVIGASAASVSYAWATTTYANDTLRISAPSGGWPLAPTTGAPAMLSISVHDLDGNALPVSKSYYVQYPPAQFFGAAPPGGLTITPDEAITLTFNGMMDASSLALQTNELGVAVASGVTAVWSTVNYANDTLTVSPPGGGWQGGSSKVLHLSAKDLNGVSSTVNASYTVQTSAGGVKSFSPAVGATIFSQTHIIITFTTSMATGSLSVTQALGVSPIGSVTTSWTTSAFANDTLTLIPPAGGWTIGNDEPLQLTVNDTALPVPNMVSASAAYNVVPDTPPSVAIVPATGATINPSSQITVTFGTSMDAATLTFTGKPGSGGTPHAVWSLNNTVLQVTPNSTWGATGVVTANQTLSFTVKDSTDFYSVTPSATYTIDGIPPTATFVPPEGYLTSPQQSLVLLFSESMDAASPQFSGQSPSSFSFTSTLKSNDTLTIAPPSGGWPSSGTFAVTTAKDLAGNNFSTAAGTSPCYATGYSCSTSQSNATSLSIALSTHVLNLATVTVPLNFVTVSNHDGSNAPTVAVNDVCNMVCALNNIYAIAGVQFSWAAGACSSSTGSNCTGSGSVTAFADTDANNNLNSLPDTVTPTAGATPPSCAARNEGDGTNGTCNASTPIVNPGAGNGTSLVAKEDSNHQTPHLTVIFRNGSGATHGFAFSDFDFVVMPATAATANCPWSLAHQIGHYFGLADTSQPVYATTSSAQSAWTSAIPNFFDGDDLVSTPPDPYIGTADVVECSGSPPATQVLNGTSFTLPQTNVMSNYFNSAKTLTAEQSFLVRQGALARFNASSGAGTMTKLIPTTGNVAVLEGEALTVSTTIGNSQLYNPGGSGGAQGNLRENFLGMWSGDTHRWFNPNPSGLSGDQAFMALTGLATSGTYHVYAVLSRGNGSGVYQINVCPSGTTCDAAGQVQVNLYDSHALGTFVGAQYLVRPTIPIDLGTHTVTSSSNLRITSQGTMSTATGYNAQFAIDFLILVQ